MVMTPECTTVLITGASSGLGAVFAETLAARSRPLVLVARRRERLEALAADLHRRHGVTVEVLVADLSVTDGMAAVTRRIVDGGDVSLLVNNAGFGTPGFFSELDIEGQLAMVTVHVEAAMRLCRAALPPMLAAKRGAIINVSSVAAFLPSLRGITYSATKAYLNMFSEGLAMEVAPYGVVVQALCPGFTRTGFHEAAGYRDAELDEIPKFLWLSAERVVDESLAALAKGKIIVIPSRRYRLLTGLIRNRLSGWLIRKLMNKKRQTHAER